MHLLVPKGHWLENIKNLKIDDLANERWVVRGGINPILLYLIERLRVDNYRPEIVYSANDYTEVQGAVGVGHGISLVPSLACLNSNEKQTMISNIAGIPPRQVYLCQLKSHKPTKPEVEMTRAILSTAHKFTGRADSGLGGISLGNTLLL